MRLHHLTICSSRRFQTAPPDEIPFHERIAITAYVFVAHGAMKKIIETAFLTYVDRGAHADSAGRVNAGLYLTLLQLKDDVGGQVKKADRTPEAVIERIPGLFEAKFVTPNNGIGRANVQTLALAAGIAWSVVEDTCGELLDAMATLGSRRGGIAHLSSISRNRTRGVRTILYPPDARSLTGPVTAHLSQLTTLPRAPRRWRTAARSAPSITTLSPSLPGVDITSLIGSGRPARGETYAVMTLTS